MSDDEYDYANEEVSQALFVGELGGDYAALTPSSTQQLYGGAPALPPDTEDYEALQVLPTQHDYQNYNPNSPILPNSSRPNSRHIPNEGFNFNPTHQHGQRHGSTASSEVTGGRPAPNPARTAAHATSRQQQNVARPTNNAHRPRSLKGPKEQVYAAQFEEHGLLGGVYVYANFNPETGSRKTYEGGHHNGYFAGKGSWTKYAPMDAPPPSGGLFSCCMPQAAPPGERCDRYVGGFKAGRFDGKGKYEYVTTKHEYNGDWKDGQYHGYGVYKFNLNGSETYIGEWAMGQYHGRGCLTRPGVKQDGQFSRGVFQH